MKKSYVLISFIVLIFLLFVINARTPFVYSVGGPWSIGFGDSNSDIDKLNVFENNSVVTYEDLIELDKNTKFLADPFFVKEKDTFYLFFEHQKKNSNADISLMTSIDGINYNYKGTVLDEEFHLSYPQVFKYKDEIYMIPESKQANQVLLYKSNKFPYNWSIEDTLIKNVNLKDPSIFLSDTLNIMVASDDNLNLKLFIADSLRGEWKPYKKKIIKRGSEARAGGRFFIDKKGLLMLPIQNCSQGYGYGLSIYNFDFSNGDLELKREFPLFLKPEKTISYFNSGMHHLDVQFINKKYYYVFDGNIEIDKKINIWGPLKINSIDLLNWFENL